MKEKMNYNKLKERAIHTDTSTHIHRAEQHGEWRHWTYEPSLEGREPKEEGRLVDAKYLVR